MELVVLQIGQVFSTGNVDAQRTPPEWMEE